MIAEMIMFGIRLGFGRFAKLRIIHTWKNR